MDQAAEGLTQRRLDQALAVLADVQLQLDSERLERARADAVLEGLFDSLSDGVLVTDPHGRVTRANRAAEELFGRPAGELIGRPVEGLYRDEIPATPWALLRLARDGHLSRETASIASDGSHRPISVSCAIVRDTHGKMQGAVHAARDLSEVHHLLHAVEAGEARWRLLADVSTHLAAALDPVDAVEHIVARLEQETGCGVAVVLSRDGIVSRTVASPGSDRAAWRSLEGAAPPAGSALAAVLTRGRPVHAAVMEPDFPLLGPVAHGLRSAVALPMADETAIAGALLVTSTRPGAVDTATVTLVEEVSTRIGLSLSNAALRDTLTEHRASAEAAQYRSDILAAISHDMKTPLSVLLGMVALLDQQPPGEGSAEVRTGIERQVRRLQRLVTQFLDYIRLEAGHELSVAPKPTDLAAVLAVCADIDGDSGRVRIDAPTPLPWVMADENRLELALANLVTNAVKYAPGATPVTVEVREVGRHVEIGVIDEGPGIAPADQPRVFEGFQRGRQEIGIEGTGLGLYMTRQLMHSQGGEVRLASRPGHGSRFTLVLGRAEKGAA